jgi:hypothetical protein
LNLPELEDEAEVERRASFPAAKNRRLCRYPLAGVTTVRGPSRKGYSLG